MLTVLTGPAQAQAQAQEPAPSVTVDGPNAAISQLSGLSVARDGSGGLVYLKQVSGVQHVFASRLLGGVFQVPEQVDGALAGASSQPVIAAGNGGLLLIAFINGGRLYVVDQASASASPGSPVELFDGASDPALELTPFGKGYLAFTAVGDGGHDVRAAYYDNQRWALVSSALDAVPSDDAGAGAGRPRVAAAGDGVAIVVWGEAGHIYSRRVWGTSPSVVYEQADVPSFSGWSEVSADEPAVAVGGDSSYADVAFHEVLSNGSQPQSRVLMRRLRGSRYEDVNPSDGLTMGAGGADQPAVAMGEYGTGVLTSARTDSNALFGDLLGGHGANGPVVRMDSLQNAALPDAASGFAGLFTQLVAWQQDPGAGGMPEIRVRLANRASSFGPELVLSTPILGPTQGASGLAVAGDLAGDGLIAWVQGTGSSTEILARGLYQPPGSFGVLSSFSYVRSSQPVLSWTAAADTWGPLAYVVTVDGAKVDETGATSLRLDSPLADGPHAWEVTVVNPAGLTSVTRTATVWVDTVAPAVELLFSGTPRVGSVIRATVNDSDSPPPELPANASGIASVVLNWGDGSSFHISHVSSHTYNRAGRYTVSVVVRDRAGNVTKVARVVHIAPRPPKRRRKPARRKPAHLPTHHGTRKR